MMETQTWDHTILLDALPHRRKRALLVFIALTATLVLLIIAGALIGDRGMTTDLDSRDMPPSFSHPFGTDWLGRDMFSRTLKGLLTSLVVGFISSTISVILALMLGLLAAVISGWMDVVVNWLVDLFMSLPHLLLIILIAFALGGGVKGVVVAVAVTHWPSLTRVVRAEVMQLMSADFVQASWRLGKSTLWVATRHMFPHVLPQVVVGYVLLFPHAILHEASITFLGFGLAPHRPAVGIILSESMKYLSVGQWWLVFFPGISLLLFILVFNRLGENLRFIVDPYRAHE